MLEIARESARWKQRVASGNDVDDENIDDDGVDSLDIEDVEDEDGGNKYAQDN